MTKIYSSLIFSIAMIGVTAGIDASAQDRADSSHPSDIPERTFVITNGDTKLPYEIVVLLYSPNDLHFQDPGAPRFLFLDRKGKLALGIGGYVKGQMMYDFDGAIDDNGFTTYKIPVPLDPAERNRLGADASHSTIYLKLVGQTSLGYLTVYEQTNFSGEDDSYGMQIKQAYVSLGNVTAGLARSTFVDASAQPPTIDCQGPSGATCGKNVLLRYSRRFDNGFSGAISAEFPKASYTLNEHVEKINQRCPDIPVNLQYAWNNDKSHVRLSGMIRNLSYRNLVKEKNEWSFGWAVQLSGMIRLCDPLTFYYQGAYGKGYAQYINDVSGFDMDLIPDGADGKMKAPAVMGVLGGLKYSFSKKFFVSASYSQCHVYDQGSLGHEGYRYGQYIVANGFYNVLPDMQVGLEYLHGRRNDMGGASGHANRISASVQYSF